MQICQLCFDGENELLRLKEYLISGDCDYAKEVQGSGGKGSANTRVGPCRRDAVSGKEDLTELLDHRCT